MGNNRRKRRIRLLLLLLLVLCLIPIGQAYYTTFRHRIQQEELRELAGSPMEKGRKLLQQKKEKPPEWSDIKELRAPVMLPGYARLYEKNSDMAGWLSIEGAGIDYPVMQSSDDEYYLHRDFYGEESRHGCLFVKQQANLNSGTNFIIYGHNMKDGSMFGNLDLYLKEDFYKKHPTVFFDTLYEERTYEIIAVFQSQVYRAEDDVFKYYQFYEADTQEEFDDFYTNIKELSLYDTGVEAEFGDTFLTLSTCAYHVEDGRLVVVAKRNI